MSRWHDDLAVETVELQIDAWLALAAEGNPTIAAIDRGEPGEPRWYVRMRGEEKDFTTVWLTLGQRTLRYETYVMPAPEENHARFYEHLLRRNDGLVGAHFSIGAVNSLCANRTPTAIRMPNTAPAAIQPISERRKSENPAYFAFPANQLTR